MGQGLLRFFLSALVVLHHKASYSFPGSDAIEVLFSLGSVAVYLFFVLSGYVIAKAWDSKYSKLPAAPLLFLLSRTWRLYPVFVITTLLAAYWQSAVPTLRDLILIETTASRLNPPAWSLDIELQFYILAPFIMAALTNRIFAAYAIIVSAVLCGLGAHGILNYLVFFLIGTVAAKQSWRPSPRLIVGSLAATIALIVASYFYEPTRFIFFSFMKSPLVTIRTSIVVAIVAAPFAIGVAQMRSNRFDHMLGGLSYPLYLIHYSLINSGDWILPATLALYIVELPSEWLRKYVIYRVVPGMASHGEARYRQGARQRWATAALYALELPSQWLRRQVGDRVVPGTGSHGETQYWPGAGRRRWATPAVVAALLAVIGASSALFWPSDGGSLPALPSFTSGKGPATAAVAIDPLAELKDFQALQGQMTGSVQSTAQLLAAQQAEIKQLAEQMAVLTAKLDLLTRPAALTEASLPAQPPSPAPRNKPAAPKPAAGISVGGAPLPPMR